MSKVIGFITAGDPSLELTEKYIGVLINNGIDMIEIGVPFSDPVAEGPVVAQADIRALANGVTLSDVLTMIEHLRIEYPDFPFYLVTYMNPIFTIGYECFFKRAKETNLSGVYIADTPCVERDEYVAYADKYDVKIIYASTPATTDESLIQIGKESKAFTYLMLPNAEKEQLNAMITVAKNRFNKCGTAPIYIELSAYDPFFNEAGQLVDGIITGSDILQIIEKEGVNAEKALIKYCQTAKKYK